MFTKQQASSIRHEFWTTFGRYMGPIPSAEGVKINWVNYHTRIKNIYFRMDASQKSATIAITIEHPDQEIQDLYFQQFLELKTVLHTTLQEEWEWQSHSPVEARTIGRIYKTMTDVSILNKDHWPDLISFFIPRIIALDEFWEHARYTFEALK